MAAHPADIGDEYSLLQGRLRTLLPEEYQDTYGEIQPISMGSAGLKFGADGRVLWNEIWGSFCHLAMAGGPPHRGTLLLPATKAAVADDKQRYREVAQELCRGIAMVSGLAAEPSAAPGWIEVDCPSTSMAGWLARAISMENISVHVDGMVLHLPAGPGFRMEKEIKNVITSVAKTCHYWLGHTSVAQHRAIGALFAAMDAESPLVQPPLYRRNPGTAASDRLRGVIAGKVFTQTGLRAAGSEYTGWLGIDVLRVPVAVWMMRVMVASNALCRREGTVLYVPVNPALDRRGTRVTSLVARAHRVARAQGVLG